MNENEKSLFLILSKYSNEGEMSFVFLIKTKEQKIV